MILDITVILILAFALFMGWRSGFVYTFLHTTGWLLSMVFAFVWREPLANFLRSRSSVFEFIQKNISERLSSYGAAGSDIFSSFPKIIRESLEQGISRAAGSLASELSELVFSALCFFIVLFLSKLILWLLISLFSKRENHGLIGFVDGLWGLIAGFVKGFIAIFVFLLLLVPVMNMVSPESSEAIQKALDSSRFAGDLFDNNLLALIIRSFLS